MKYLAIIYFVFQFFFEKLTESIKKIEVVYLVIGTAIIFLLGILVFILSPDDSDIKNHYLRTHNFSNNVKCYQTVNGLRTNNFRIYEGNSYTTINVVYVKWDIYPKGSNKNGFYLGKCDILDKSGKVIKF